VGRLVAASTAAALLLCGCTGSKDNAGTPPAQTGPGSLSEGVGSTSPPAGAGSLIPSGPGAGSLGPASDTYTPPTTAPYPTPGRSPARITNQTAVLSTLPGSAESACAQVGSRTDVRSGGIGMGNFQVAKRAYSTQLDKSEVPQLYFYVIPQHTAHLTAAAVRIDPPGSAAPASTIHSKQIEEADAYRYFAVVLPIRTAGVYRLTVTSGADQGCFIVSFSR
jgi:hypothetical protein